MCAKNETTCACKIILSSYSHKSKPPGDGTSLFSRKEGRKENVYVSLQFFSFILPPVLPLSAHHLYIVILSPIHFRLIVFQWLCKCSFSSLAQCRFQFRLNSSLYFAFAHGHHRWGSTLMDFFVSLLFFYWSKNLGWWWIEIRISVMLCDERTGSVESGQRYRKPDEALEGRSRASEGKKLLPSHQNSISNSQRSSLCVSLALSLECQLSPWYLNALHVLCCYALDFSPLLSLCRAKWKIIWWQNRKKERWQLRERLGGEF